MATIPAPHPPDGVTGVAPAANREASSSGRSGLARLGRSLGGAALLGAGGLAWWWLATHHFADGEHAPTRPVEPVVSAASGEGMLVRLPAGSAAAAEIEVVPVQTRQLREHLTVPGRLDYDARSRVDYECPVEGIVSQVFVKVRQAVPKGAPLAEVSSPEVGMARNDVRKREDDLRIERKAAEWAVAIADNVDALLGALTTHPPLDTIERQFQDRVLGSYREKILAAYSRLLFVEKVNASTRQLSEGGVLSGRIIEERASNLEVAKANFTAACEESQFLTRQDRDRAQAGVEQAERLVTVSRENLRTLVGSRLDADAVGEAGESGAADGEGSDGEAGSLSALVLRTPVAGIVEDIFVARGERVQAGDRLFVVADNSTLWVRAQIHERQWTTVEVTDGQEVAVNVPGAAEHRTTARINHVGATVEADSRSVPLVAELKNDDAHYKPGMFVWVDLPQGQVRSGLAVPSAAVMRHEDRSFVFVPEGEGAYRRVAIEPGITSDEFVEVKKGLEAGQQVVARGAFLLKSELLLEDEG